MPFDNLPLFRQVDADGLTKQTARASTLRIVVTDARAGGTRDLGTLLLINAGTLRFGQDQEVPREDLSNENSEDSEVDEGMRRTVMLNLRLENLLDGQALLRAGRFVGSTSLAALGNVGLATTDAYGCAIDNAITALQTPPGGDTARRPDLWMYSDVIAELYNQLNRVGYQCWSVLPLSDRP